jgi:hypothetical protein
MYGRATTISFRLFSTLASVAFASAFAGGCGGDGGNKLGDPVLEHEEFRLASTEAGGGELTGDFDFTRPLGLFFTTCVGGTGDQCDGGTVLYSAVTPGIEPLEEEDPDRSLFFLQDGTQVTLELTAIDEGLSLHFDDIVLDQPGQTVTLDPLPDLHADVDSQLVLPGGPPKGHYDASFVLRAPGTVYGDSREFTITFVPLAEHGGSEG